MWRGFDVVVVLLLRLLLKSIVLVSLLVCCINITQTLPQCHKNIQTTLHQCCTNAAKNVAATLHQCCTDVARNVAATLHQCCTDFGCQCGKKCCSNIEHLVRVYEMCKFGEGDSIAEMFLQLHRWDHFFPYACLHPPVRGWCGGGWL